MNVFTFSGRVGADPELRTTPSGEKVLSFRVANDVGFGERRHTSWYDCSYWGKRGEAIATFFKKGDRVTVSGELKLEEFQRRDGAAGTKGSVRVNDMDLPSKADQGGGQGGGGYQSGGGPARSQGGGPAGGAPGYNSDLDDELPFVARAGLGPSSEVCDEPRRTSWANFQA